MVNLAIESYAKAVIAVFVISALSALIVYTTGLYKSFVTSHFSPNHQEILANVRKTDFMKLLYACWQKGEHLNEKETECYTVSVKEVISKSDIQSYVSSSGTPVDMHSVPNTISPGEIVIIYYKAGLVRLKVYK